MTEVRSSEEDPKAEPLNEAARRLRSETGAGIMDCRHALISCQMDFFINCDRGLHDTTY